MPRKNKRSIKREGKPDLRDFGSHERKRLMSLTYQERASELYERHIKGKVKIECKSKKYTRFVHKKKAERLLKEGIIYQCETTGKLYER